MRTLVLQPWTTMTLSSTYTQGAEGYLDLSDFGDVAFWVDVAASGKLSSGSQGAAPTLTIQSAPSCDGAYFEAIGPTVSLATAGTFVLKSVRGASTVPLARWVRYQLGVTGSGVIAYATFRIRVAPLRQSFFLPTQIAGCVLWLRPDLAFTNVAPTASWVDQSASADPNKTLGQGSSHGPGLPSSNASFNSQSTLSLSAVSSNYMVSAGAWASPLLQPSTWVVVANNSDSSAAAEYLIDADDATTGQSVQYTGSTTTLAISANGSSVSTTASWANAGALLGEWNGSSSNLYFNNFTTPLASGTVGGGTAGSQGSMTFGSKNQSSGGGSYWSGSIAEIIAYSGVLAAADKARLRLYLNSRYNLSIT